MRHIQLKNAVWIVGLVAVVAFAASIANATPNPNSAVLFERVFNDCPFTTLTSLNNYPTQVWFRDEETTDCGGFANLHVWRFSEDGMDYALFPNYSAFTFCCILTITGTAEGEAGLQISPWWSPLVDGRFNVRTTDGEIACFGGRLPFYSFTFNHGVTYMIGNSIFLRMTYLPNDLTEMNPATIQYDLIYDGMAYSSGPLPFDEGNPGEPYGTWGILDDATAGGHVQILWQQSDPMTWLKADWTSICFQNLDAVPVEAATWGSVKSLYR
jgi:hypothetical protein